MTTDMKIAQEPTKPLEDFVIEDAYQAWQRREGVRVIRDFAFEDLRTVELSPWPRKGGAGAIINIPNEHLPVDSHLVEIAAGGQSEPERHMYEEIVYVLSGRGATRIWQDGQEPQTFEWQAGSLFSIPLNAWYQHFNAGTEPARYIAVTNAPPMMISSSTIPSRSPAATAATATTSAAASSTSAAGCAGCGRPTSCPTRRTWRCTV
jgi:quercetin dioxygenase-like cupin family protein